MGINTGQFHYYCKLNMTSHSHIQSTRNLSKTHQKHNSKKERMKETLIEENESYKLFSN